MACLCVCDLDSIAGLGMRLICVVFYYLVQAQNEMLCSCSGISTMNMTSSDDEMLNVTGMYVPLLIFTTDDVYYYAVLT